MSPQLCCYKDLNSNCLNDLYLQCQDRKICLEVGLYPAFHYHKQLHDIHHDSLLTSNRSDDDQVYIPSRVGDAVIFDVRITHKGWYPEISFARKFFTKILKRVGFKIPIKVPFQKKSVFFSYGANNKYTKEFALKNMERQVKQNGFDISVMPPTLRSTLEENISFSMIVTVDSVTLPLGCSGA